MIECFAFMFGAIVGSFLNVCIYRMPVGESIVFPASHCQACRRPIAWFDNIPIVSFIMLRGRCRRCHAGISYQYMLVEILTGFLFILFYRVYGFTAPGFVYLAFATALVVVSLIDLRHRIIPDEISVGGMVLGLLLSGLFPVLHDTTSWKTALLRSFLGLMVGGGFLYLMAIITEFIVKKEAMGGGDIKLIAMIGAVLGFWGAIWAIFFSSLLGSAVGVYQRARHGEQYIPYGPYLALGGITYLFFGKTLVDLYLKSIGLM